MASREVSPFILSISPADVSISVAVVFAVKFDIGGFWGLPFGDDWEFNRGRGGGTPGVSARATNAPCYSMGPEEVCVERPLRTVSRGKIGCEGIGDCIVRQHFISTITNT